MKYPEDIIARAFIHHTLAAVVMYDCDRGNKFQLLHPLDVTVVLR